MATEKRLIDANALSSIAFQIAQYGKGIRCVVDLNDVDDMPTVDAVEVVRCKDCKHRVKATIRDAYLCNAPYGLSGIVPLKDDDFCSYGERRTDDG